MLRYDTEQAVWVGTFLSQHSLNQSTTEKYTSRFKYLNFVQSKWKACLRLAIINRRLAIAKACDLQLGLEPWTMQQNILQAQIPVENPAGREHSLNSKSQHIERRSRDPSQPQTREILAAVQEILVK